MPMLGSGTVLSSWFGLGYGTVVMEDGVRSDPGYGVVRAEVGSGSNSVMLDGLWLEMSSWDWLPRLVHHDVCGYVGRLSVCVWRSLVWWL